MIVNPHSLSPNHTTLGPAAGPSCSWRSWRRRGDCLGRPGALLERWVFCTIRVNFTLTLLLTLDIHIPTNAVMPPIVASETYSRNLYKETWSKLARLFLIEVSCNWIESGFRTSLYKKFDEINLQEDYDIVLQKIVYLRPKSITPISASKSATSWPLPRSKFTTSPQHKRQVRNKFFRFPALVRLHGTVFLHFWETKRYPWTLLSVVSNVFCLLHTDTAHERIRDF